MPLHNTRKVLRVGERSYAISIPKEWARRLGIAPGDLVDLILYDDGIIEVRPISRASLASSSTLSVVFKLRNNTKIENVQSFLEAMYTVGVNKVLLNTSSIDIQKLRKNIMNYLGLIPSFRNGTVQINIALSEVILEPKEMYEDIIALFREYYDEFELLVESKSDHLDRIEEIYRELKSKLMVLIRIMRRKHIELSRRNNTNVDILIEVLRLLKIIIEYINVLTIEFTGMNHNEYLTLIIKRIDKILFDTLRSIKEPEPDKIVKLLNTLSDIKTDLIRTDRECKTYILPLIVLVNELLLLSLENTVTNLILKPPSFIEQNTVKTK